MEQGGASFHKAIKMFLWSLEMIGNVGVGKVHIRSGYPANGRALFFIVREE